MKEVNVNRDELLKALKENRDKHVSMLEKAIDGYRKAWLQVLEDRIDHIRSGGNIKKSIQLPEPQDHRADYNRVIKMVEMSQDETLKLTDREFSNYVMDEWEWRVISDFSNAAYAVGRIPGDDEF